MPEIPPHGPQPPLEPPASRDPHPAAGTAPAGVPDELLDIAAEVALRNEQTRGTRLVLSRILAAVLDRHEAMVRADERQKIAEEVRAVNPDPGRLWDVNQHMAARATKEQILKRVTRGGSDV